MEKIKESIFSFIFKNLSIIFCVEPEYFKKRRGKSPPRFSRNKAPQNANPSKKI